MPCPRCGLALDPTTGTCPRCGRGATVIMHDPSEASAAGPMPTMREPVVAQSAPGVVASPSFGFAGVPADANTRAGLVWRAAIGTTSLMMGAVMTLLALVALTGWANEMVDGYSSRLPVGVLLGAGVIIGLLEIVAAVLLLSGFRLPLLPYALALLAQLLGSIGIIVARIVDDGRFRFGDLLPAMLILIGFMVLPVLRLVVMIVPQSGAKLGTRKRSTGTALRSIPSVLWVSVVGLLGSATLPFVLLAALGATISAFVGHEDPIEAVLLVAALHLSWMAQAGNLTASIGMLRRTRWSFGLGGASGLLGLVAGLGLLASLVVAELDGGRFSEEKLFMALIGGLALASVVVPSLALVGAAIKARFRLPDYLRSDASAPRRKLMEVLVG